MTTKEYNTCVKNYADGLYRFALKTMKSESLAQDIVQDSFEKLWVKAKGIKFEKAKSYLFSTAHNKMIDHFRRQQRNPIEEVENESMQFKTQQGSVDLQDILEEALDTLPEIQKSVVLLRDYEGYSYQEIAEITHFNEGQVKVYIYRARKQLKQFLVSIDHII